MRKKIFLIISFLCFFLPINASQTFCTAHDGEIISIRNQAEEAIWQAHRVGHLFRHTALGERDASYRSVKYKSTYSEFSEVFHRFINISDPEGIPHLYEGYSKTTNLFLDLYNNCIKNHSNIGSKYERGRIFFDNNYMKNQSKISKMYCNLVSGKIFPRIKQLQMKSF